MTRNLIAALLTINVGLFAATPALAGSWQNSAPFGATLQGDLYTPTTPGASPAILVVIHMCTGHSSTVHGWFDSYADKTGFYIIAPDAGKQCFDSSASRDGDKAAIIKMVDTVVALGGDKSRVFAAGYSSGGCMTNTLLAVYPDVFAGGSAMPGFPAWLWPANDTTCTKCNSTPGTGDTGQKYASMATSAFAFSGTRPCSEQWVGGGDQYNFNGWLPVVASQFQILGNLGDGASAASGISGWTRTVYQDGSGNVRLETNLGPSTQKHDLETVGSNLYAQVVSFLGLDTPTGVCSASDVTGVGTSGTGGASSVAAGGTQGTTGGASSIDTSAGGATDASAAGGESAVSNSTPSTTNNQSGCGCRVAGSRNRAGALWGLGLLGAMVAVRRRRQRNQ